MFLPLLHGTMPATPCWASGGVWGSCWSSWSRFNIRQPSAPVHQGWDLVSIPALLPIEGSICAEFGQETVFCPSSGGSQVLFLLVQASKSKRFSYPLGQ